MSADQIIGRTISHYRVVEKIGAGGMGVVFRALDLNLERTNLVDLVRRMASSVQALSTNHCITVRAPAPVFGLWDPARLEQVIQNLLTNSIKYSPKGGSVRVDVTSDGSEATLSVTDKGLGIAAEELPQLFHRFYRVARTRGLEGSGLGLYVCRAIIAAHGGRIWATSNGPGRGSTFAFALACEAQMERVA